MAEWSALWQTDPAGIGDQEVGYTESHWSDIGRILAACAGFEGVAPGYGNELAATDVGGGDIEIDTGGAVSDGKVYDNTTPVTINIPTPAAGNERIDRIVARCTWAGYIVRLTRIAGLAAPVPVAPAITQTSGITYDVMLWQARITDGGVITLTDERVFAGVNVDGVTLQAVGGILSVTNNGIGNAQLRDSAALSVIGRAANSVGDPADIVAGTDAHVLRRSGATIGFGQITGAGIDTGTVTRSNLAETVMALDGRVGGSGVNWNVPGANNYTPGDVQVFAGSVSVTVLNGATLGTANVTFPAVFFAEPLIILSINNLGGASSAVEGVFVYGVTGTVVNARTDFQMRVQFSAAVGADTTFIFNWIAIGPPV